MELSKACDFISKAKDDRVIGYICICQVRGSLATESGHKRKKNNNQFLEISIAPADTMEKSKKQKAKSQ